MQDPIVGILPKKLPRSNARLRRLWLNFHLWIGLGLAILLVPISLSGAALVWQDNLDSWIHPSRYAVTAGPSQPAQALLSAATAALPRGFEPTVLRLPKSEGWPAQITAREARQGERGGRPKLLTVYVDPASARVLAVVEFRNSIVGLLHRFHENLTVPEYSGRAVVGWTGVAMLAMSLSGLYLWWPSGGFLRGLRYRRGPALSFNLHHLFGFWISIPLAVVSATGIYLGFPQQGRELIASIAPMSPSQRGGFNATLVAGLHLNVDRVLVIVAEGASGMQPTAVFLPTMPAQTWRVLLKAGAGDAAMLVADGSGALSTVTPQSGDRIAQWVRWIHEGSHAGAIWAFVVFLCGALPTGFAVTGMMIWLRKRRAKAMSGIVVSPGLRVDPAE
jgi:uncharacterized iron-regulated membrane protein